ncbi:hypothetical protein ACEPPI_18650, partial [Streptomyces sp. AB3(2024)]
MAVLVAAGISCAVFAVAPAQATSTPLDHHDKGGAGQGQTATAKGSNGPAAGAPSSSAASATITRSEAVARAESWVGKGLKYSWDNTYQGYRTDCSGYVSMGWKLGTPGLDTTRFVPSGAASWLGGKGDLKPGDALLNDAAGASGHIVMFDRWTDSSQTSYMGYEFTGSGVHHRVIPYPYFSGYGTFRPARSNSIVDDATPTPTTATTVGVYRPGESWFYVSDRGGNLSGKAAFGAQGDMPLTG